MAPFQASRWVNPEEDAALSKRRKEERQRRKVVEQQVQQQKRLQLQKSATASPNATANDESDGEATRPAKKRRLLPTPPSLTAAANATVANLKRAELSPTTSSGPLYRFPPCHWHWARPANDYDRLNDIEEGTYGWVVRAKRISTGQVVALKRLKLDPRDRSGLPVTGLREIQILKECRHRNIVELQDVVVGPDRNNKLDIELPLTVFFRHILPHRSIFLVLEFVEHDVKTILQDMNEPFLPSEIKRLLLQLASGLEYLHNKWILHRDLKTSNLLLNNRGQLKIADFGMARYVGDPAPSLTQLVVTLWYRAPELLLGTTTYDHTVDMWSFGCIFAELLTREPLLQGKNELDQVTKTFDLLGFPTEASWPGFRKLPHVRSMKLPTRLSSSSPSSSTTNIRTRFSFLTKAGCELLGDLLSLDPSRRPRAEDIASHEYFCQDPKPKQEIMFPTFPSKAGQERRRRRDEPHAPTRGDADITASARNLDFSDAI